MSPTRKDRNTLTFTIDIARPIAVVFGHLSVPQNFIGLQPLLIDISEVNKTTENGVIVHRYTTTEEFRFFGFIPYHNRIHVTTRLTNPHTRLDTHVESPGGVTLDVEYHLSASTLGTHLQEVIHIQSLRITTGFVLREATKAQNTLLARLKERLESQPA
ncbi:MAG: SRPBCC family protein [Anaerolineae bacterium]|nr:SRPBCC family protein [Anaerolineae bacterium]